MYCRQCGYNNDQYSKLCHRCGSVLREAEDLYDKEQEIEENELQQEGVLKYARKSEDLISQIKAPFRRLERATRNEKKQMLGIVIIAAAVLCAAVWLTVAGTKACSVVPETVYGNQNANIAQQAIAASDGEFVYYSCPFGTNPGLYRRSIATGEELKISYMCLDNLSVVNDWVYGTDTEGRVVRISSDGITLQQVIDDTWVKGLTVVDNYIYYIGWGGYIYRADTETITRRHFADIKRLTELRAAEFIIHNDVIYYIELTDDAYNNIFAKNANYLSVVDAPEGSRFDFYSGQPDIFGANIVEACGCIRRMLMDGSEDTEILGTPVMRLTGADDYLYFQSETTITVSYTDVPPEDADEDEEYVPIVVTKQLDTTKCWRLELNRLKYSTMLDPHIADSHMTPAADGWFYYVNIDGNLERTDSNGGERYDVLTYQQYVDRFSVIDRWIYCLTDGGSRVVRINAENGSVEILCERLEEIEAQSGQEEQTAAE